MLKALDSTLGVVHRAAKTCGVPRRTHYNWMASDPEYAAAVTDIQEAAVDFAESALHHQIKEGNVTATIFYLKTKGKARGYVETQDITSGGQPLQQPTWFEPTSDIPPRQE